ncbi:uncharacterized protein METZ01_LOCUS410941, partial [marine metagenome]
STDDTALATAWENRPLPGDSFYSFRRVLTKKPTLKHPIILCN